MGNKFTIEIYKNWYNSCVAELNDNSEKYLYHLYKQISILDLKNKKILEIGCGKGAVSLFLAMFFEIEKITSLDEAAGEGAPIGINNTLREAVNNFNINNIEVVDKDIMRNSYPDGFFDILIANNALHHVIDSGKITGDNNVHKEYSKLFIELRRLLCEGGYLSINEFSRLSIWSWFPIKFRWKNIEWDLHPTQKEWLSVIKEAGFTIISTKYLVPYPLRHFEFLFSNSLAQYFYYPSFVITAKK
jgi:SAM-dependent methyltransferase